MIKNPSLVPPDDFDYQQPETGVHRNGRSLAGTISLVQEHRISNNLPRQAVDEVRDDVELQICQRSPDSYCYGNLSVAQEGDIGREQILSGIKALGSWLVATMSGESVFVDQAEADRRAGICARCFLNKGGHGCSGCSFGDKMREAIGLTIGDRSTPRDQVLKACRVCGCANRVQVWFKSEILNRLMSDPEREKFAAVSHCWKGRDS